ncbi:NAD-dependent succinate-semialdehyde dehydrogenase [Thalassotalea fusca]
MNDLANSTLLIHHSIINGEPCTSNEHFDVVNPATNECIATMSEVTDGQLELAIQTSKSAQRDWQKQDAHTRAKILHKWHDLIAKNSHDLALILTREQGKTLSDARGEILYGNSFIEWFAEEGKRVYGDVIQSPSNDKRMLTIKQPVGVVAAITPWNFPSAMITRKAAAAFAAGCSFVVKPAAETPLSALALAKLAIDAGMPKGLFNVVIGTNAAQIGRVLTSHPDIAKFTFTGSTQTGKILTEQCASTVKRVSMELGGNAPFIVFEDADLDAAAQALFNAKFRNCGQTCISPNRIYVHHRIHSAFTDKLIALVQTLKQGSGEDKRNNLGCLIHDSAAKKVHDMVSNAINEGAKVEFGSLSHQPEDSFYPPTILSNVSHGTAITQQEIFGPVLPLIPFNDDEQVVNFANDTNFGLASYFYTQNIQRLFKVSEALEYGMVGANDTMISNTVAPFGGIKQSGYGREGSKYGLDDYMAIKYVCIGGQ